MTRRVQRISRRGGSGRVAVAAIVALGSVCLAGSPLYLSSVATAALQSELSHTCLADLGLHIAVDSTELDAGTVLTGMAVSIAEHTQPAVLTRIGTVFLDLGNGQLPRRGYLVYRDGQQRHLRRAVPAPADGEVLAPEWLGAPDYVQPGAPVTLSARDRSGTIVWSRRMTVVDTYPLVPTRPEPAFWCGMRVFFRSQTGDPADLPPPVLLTTSEEVRTAEAPNTADWELRPDPNGMSRHDAVVLADRFDELAKAATRMVTLGQAAPAAQQAGDPLRAVVRRAEAATEVVAGTMAPVRLVGLLASVALLISATTLLAREQQRELRLRLLKGQSAPALGLRVAGSALGAVVAGTLAGGGLAVAGVRYLGPSPLFEAAAVRSAVSWALLGALIASVIVAVAAAARARTFVDAPVRSRPWARYLPWELIPVAGVAFTFARLDRVGGIRQVGTRVANADFWAQCFLVFAIITPLAVVARPTLMVLRRCRLAGPRLPPAVMTGLRRSLAEPVVTAALLLATALAVGSFTVARLLTDSTSVLLEDKASTFLGSDLSIVSNDVDALPPPFDKSGTIVGRAQGHSGSESVDLLGIDRATFARAVRWRADSSDRTLDRLLEAIQPRSDGPIPAIIVGPLPSTTVENVVNRVIEIDPVAGARWFPGVRNGATLVVVDGAALSSEMPTATEIWIRDPPPDAVVALSDAGFVVRNPRDLSQVFDVTSFHTVRWAYATLSMLGALVGVVVLLTQLLVLDARRQVRQAAHVLTTRMGMTRRGEAVALATELGPALLCGAVLGTVIGLVVSLIAVPRLDSLRNLRPVARLVARPGAALPVIAGVAGCLILLIAVGLWMVGRTRPMEVMRGTA